MGPDLVGSQRFGHGVALSSDGNRVALGKSSPEIKDYGHVRIYDWAGSQWSQVGSDLVGEVAGDWFGSRDDTVHVQIFWWSGTQWTQLGLILPNVLLADATKRAEKIFDFFLDLNKIWL